MATGIVNGAVMGAVGFGLIGLMVGLFSLVFGYRGGKIAVFLLLLAFMVYSAVKYG